MQWRRNIFAVKNVVWKSLIPGFKRQLPKIIGEMRFRRILERTYYQEAVGSDKETHALMLGMADVRLEDLVELFAECKNSRLKTLRHLSRAQTKALRDSLLPYETFEGLPREAIDLLMFVLVPVNTLDDIFLDHPKPVVENGCLDSGATFASMQVLVLYLNYLRLAAKLDLPAYWNVLGKRIIDCEPEVGTVIPHLAGYYSVAENFSGNHAIPVKDFFRGGSYIAALEPVSLCSDDFRPLLLCRGTRIFTTLRGSPSTAEMRSLYDNMRACQGADGVMLDFQHIAAFLKRPVWERQPLWLGGMSLGGGHAQRLTLALLAQQKKVAQLFVVSGIGIDSLSLKWFRHWAVRLDKIHYFLDLKDPIFLLGDGHLGLHCPDQPVEFWCMSASAQQLLPDKATAVLSSTTDEKSDEDIESVLSTPGDTDEIQQDSEEQSCLPPMRSMSADTFLMQYAAEHRYAENKHKENLTTFLGGLGNFHCLDLCWYENRKNASLSHFTRFSVPEGVEWLLNNQSGSKKYLEQTRQHMLIFKHYNKFVDFLSTLSAVKTVNLFLKAGDSDALNKYQSNHKKYIFNFFKRDVISPVDYLSGDKEANEPEQQCFRRKGT